MEGLPGTAEVGFVSEGPKRPPCSTCAWFVAGRCPSWLFAVAMSITTSSSLTRQTNKQASHVCCCCSVAAGTRRSSRQSSACRRPGVASRPAQPSPACAQLHWCCRRPTGAGRYAGSLQWATPLLCTCSQSTGWAGSGRPSCGRAGRPLCFRLLSRATSSARGAWRFARVFIEVS